MKNIIVYSILLFLLHITQVVSSEEWEFQPLFLTYNDFTFTIGDVCTPDNNECGYAHPPPKSVLFGTMHKQITLPGDIEYINVSVVIPSNGWGEGLGVNKFAWTMESGLDIRVDEEIQKERIDEWPDCDPHYYEGTTSYYRYTKDHCFSHTFNVAGKDSIDLSLEMKGNARLDFDYVVITFHPEGKNEPQFITNLCYGPYRDYENPNYLVLPTIDEMIDDIEFLSRFCKSIRTYGAAYSLNEIPNIAHSYGLECYPGAWISTSERDNDIEIQSLIQIAQQNLGNVKGLIVGNEALLRNDVSVEQLIEYIEQVREVTDIPVGTAEYWVKFDEHRELVDHVDFVMMHVHPYWESIPIENAAEYVFDKWKYLKTNVAPTKPVIIGETGWPSKGSRINDSIPSEGNQWKFIQDFEQLARRNGVDYFLFEAYDEEWKGLELSRLVEGYWGMYDSKGTIKPLMKNFVPDVVWMGTNRPKRDFFPPTVEFPLIVYSERSLMLPSFHSSGWMGQFMNWGGNPVEVLDSLSTQNPHTGEICTRINYVPQLEDWAGVYWQYPLNNWGEYPGYDLSGADRLTFWVRGEIGNENVEFLTGGINTWNVNQCNVNYSDSFGPISTGIIDLKDEWTQIAIDLDGLDLRMVIGGFAFVISKSENPNGCIFYIDDIQFENAASIKDWMIIR